MEATTTRLALGLHRGVPFSTYADLRAMNSGALRAGRETLALMRHEMVDGRESSDALDLGICCHEMIFEPDTVASRVAVSPKFDRRTNVGKADSAAFEAANVGKLIVNTDDYATAKLVAESIRKHPEARRLLDATGPCEATAVWVDEETRLLCKARLDKFIPGVVALDLKTTRKASPRMFAKSVASYGYAQQAAWYLDGFKAVTGEDTPFTFIAAETAPAYGVGVYTLKNEDIEAARQLNRRILRAFAEAQKCGEWPCYSDKVEELEVPAWAFELGSGLGGFGLPEADDHAF